MKLSAVLRDFYQSNGGMSVRMLSVYFFLLQHQYPTQASVVALFLGEDSKLVSSLLLRLVEGGYAYRCKNSQGVWEYYPIVCVGVASYCQGAAAHCLQLRKLTDLGCNLKLPALIGLMGLYESQKPLSLAEIAQYISGDANDKTSQNVPTQLLEYNLVLEGSLAVSLRRGKRNISTYRLKKNVQGFLKYVLR